VVGVVWCLIAVAGGQSWDQLQFHTAGRGRQCPVGGAYGGGRCNSGSFYGNSGSSANRGSGFMSLPSVRICSAISDSC